MELPIYQVDAFANRLFAGNPAAVVPLIKWLPDETLRKVAMENNLSETAFFTGSNGSYRLRWFTPAREVDLCGHATLATAFVIFMHYPPGADELRFDTASGDLRARREGGLLWLDFPVRRGEAWDDHGAVGDALRRRPGMMLKTNLDDPDSDKLVAVFESAREVAELAPDMQKMLALPGQGVVATAPGMNGTDFVSRYFAPKIGIPEDPVTGATHCTLVPYWAGRFDRTSLSAQQLSSRGGAIECRMDGERVRLGGRAVQYLSGTISI